MSDTPTAILPKDKATVVVPTGPYAHPTQSYREDFVGFAPEAITFKHRDGEKHRLLKLYGDLYGVFGLERTDEQDEWVQESCYHPNVAASVLADEQAFGYRLNRQAINPHDVPEQEMADLIEIEPLDRGALIVNDIDHLPVVLHRQDRMVFRLRESIHTDPLHEQRRFIIEKASTSRLMTTWELIDYTEEDTSVTDAVQQFCDRVSVEVLTGDISQETLDAALDDSYVFREAAEDEEDARVRQLMMIQDKTVVFEDEIDDTIGDN